jgi:TATA-binding protein-associated factor
MKHSVESNSPPISSNTLGVPPFPSFSVQELIQKGTQLLASSGKEFTKPSVILASSAEVKKARKEAMGRLGLDFLEFGGGDDDMDIEKELAADAAETSTTEEANNHNDSANMDVDHPVKSEPTAGAPGAPIVSPMDSSFASLNIKLESDPSAGGQPQMVRRKSSGSGTGTPTAVPSSPPRTTAESISAPSGATDTEGLSARELNRLKRKRKGGNAAFVAAPAPPPPSSAGSGAKFAPTASGNSNKCAYIHLLLLFLSSLTFHVTCA